MMRDRIHSENNNLLHTGIHIQIHVGLFTLQGLDRVTCVLCELVEI